MASESYSISQSSVTTKDEFEGLEMTEFDPNTLQELLYEPGEEVEGGGALMQSTEVAGANPNLAVESYWCVDDTNDYLESFKWLDVIEETSAPCNDIGTWYEVPCMEEINEVFEMGNYSLSHHAILTDEIGYIGLWQEN